MKKTAKSGASYANGSPFIARRIDYDKAWAWDKHWRERIFID